LSRHANGLDYSSFEKIHAFVLDRIEAVTGARVPEHFIDKEFSVLETVFCQLLRAILLAIMRNVLFLQLLCRNTQNLNRVI